MGKPARCAHPNCNDGECKKCAWNPSSSYPAWHYDSALPYQFGWFAIVVTIIVSGTIGWFWTIFRG